VIRPRGRSFLIFRCYLTCFLVWQSSFASPFPFGRFVFSGHCIPVDVPFFRFFLENLVTPPEPIPPKWKSLPGRPLRMAALHFSFFFYSAFTACVRCLSQPTHAVYPNRRAYFFFVLPFPCLLCCFFFFTFPSMPEFFHLAASAFPFPSLFLSTLR